MVSNLFLKDTVTTTTYTLSLRQAFSQQKKADLEIVNYQKKKTTTERLTLPYSAGVVLGARDNGITIVVERTTENLIRVALQHLQTVASLGLPDARGFVRGGSEDAGALGVEGHLGDLAFVAGEDGVAGAGHGVVHTGVAVRRRRHQLGT